LLHPALTTNNRYLSYTFA